MATFQKYLAYDDDGEHSKKQLKIINKITLSENTITKIKNIKKEINILMVAQVSCPDCRALVPFVYKFSQLNDKINIKYSNRDESRLILKSKTGFEKIPTIFHNNGEKLEVFLVEFPKIVVDIINSNPENYDTIKYDFRTGKYNQEIETEFVNFFTSI